MTFVEFTEAVATAVDILPLRHPSQPCCIWISENKHVAELWYDDVNRRAELQLHKIGRPQLSVAAFPLTEKGAKDLAFSINSYIAKV